MFSSSYYYALIPAAGNGTRMGEAAPCGESKVLLDISPENNILETVIKSIVASEVCKGIIIACRKSDKKNIENILSNSAPGLDNAVIIGGESRQESVYLALTALEHRADFVLIHDGARPFCPPHKIREVAVTALETGAATLGLPLKFSIKEIDQNNSVKRTIPRKNIWEVQTPQVFKYDLILSAHQQADADNFQATDDCELVERQGISVAMIPGDERNIKITTPFDLENAIAFSKKIKK